MDAILTAVSSVVTALVGWVGQFATAITASPIQQEQLQPN